MNAPRERPPPWEWDETVLAWDLYLREYQGRYADASNAAVRALSEELRALPLHPEGVRRQSRFRNPDGVARKIQNLMFAATGRGSANGSAMDRRVVAELGDPAEVARVATTIRDVAPLAVGEEPVEGEEGFTVVEGRLIARFHLTRERRSSAVRKKKAAALASGRPITCEVCGVEVARRYGVPEGEVIECHHRLPLAEGIRQTTPADLALVCPTCHRALHRIRPWTTVEELKARLLD